MTIKDFAQDIRTWIGVIGAIVAVAVVIAKYVELPKKVEEVEEAVAVHDDSIKKLATSVDTYVTEQQNTQSMLLKVILEK